MKPVALTMPPRKLALTVCLCAAPLAALADADDDAANAVFSAAFAESCTAAFQEDGALVEPPGRFDVTVPQDWGEPEPMILWQFRCNIGAYNLQTVVLAKTEFDGIVPLSFPRPDIDVVLEDPEDFEGAVKEVRVTGWSSNYYVVNGDFDVATGRMQENGYWRGIGDASSVAVWQLVNDGFRLVRFDVDPTYDGEVNPSTLVSFE